MLAFTRYLSLPFSLELLRCVNKRPTRELNLKFNPARTWDGYVDIN